MIDAKGLDWTAHTSPVSSRLAVCFTLSLSLSSLPLSPVVDVTTVYQCAGQRGGTPLILAAMKGFTATVRLLLEAKPREWLANADNARQFVLPASSAASREGHPEVVRLLGTVIPVEL